MQMSQTTSPPGCFPSWGIASSSFPDPYCPTTKPEALGGGVRVLTLVFLVSPLPQLGPMLHQFSPKDAFTHLTCDPELTRDAAGLEESQKRTSCSKKRSGVIVRGACVL